MGMPHTLHIEQWLPLPIEEVFRFFADAENLERITPTELQFRITSPLPIDMRPGALIDYRLKLHGIPFNWRTLISRWEPPYCFVDEQLKGPYAVWHHTHTFREERGGTLIVDDVRYKLPLEPLGNIAHPLIRKQLDRIFSYRKAVIAELLTPQGKARLAA